MKSPWRLRDYVFAAFMTIGMLVSVVIVGPLVPLPFLDLIFWAPLGGIFLTLGMARLQRRGSVALMIVPFAVLMLPLSPLITLYLVLTTILTEGAIGWRGNYRTKGNRLLGNIVFFASAVLIGLGSILGLVAMVNAGSVPTSDGLTQMLEKFAPLVNQSWLLGVLTIAGALTGSLGWWLGERVIQQLRRAGKLDVED